MLKRIMFFAAALMLSLGFTVQSDIIEGGGFEVVPLAGEFQIGVPVYSINGLADFENVSEGSKITMRLDGAGNIGEDTVALCTLKDKDGDVLSANYAKVQKIGREFYFETELLSPQSMKSGEYILKTYIWKNLGCDKIYTDTFEFCDGNNPQYRSNVWSGIGGTAAVSSADKKTGYSSLCIKSSQNNSGNVISADISFSDYGIRRLAFSAKGDSQFGYDVQDESGNTMLADGMLTFGGSSEWITAGGAVFNPDIYENTKLVIKDIGNSGISYIDDVEITRNLLDCGELTLNHEKKTGKFTVIENKRYTFSFEAQGDVCTAYVKSGDRIIASGSSLKSSDFQRCEFDFYADGGQSELSYVVFTHGNSDVRNVRAEEMSRELLINGDFEINLESEFEGWHSSGGGKLTAVQGHDGSGTAVKHTGRANAYSRIRQDITENLNKFSFPLTVRVTGWVRYDEDEIGDKTAPVSMVVMTDSTTSTAFHVDSNNGKEDGVLGSVGKDWQYFDTELTIPYFNKNNKELQTAESAYFYLESGAYAKSKDDAFTKASVYMDDVRVEVIGRNVEMTPIENEDIVDLSTELSETGGRQ